MKRTDCRVIVIGDSTNNTLSIIRSFGEAKINQILILKCDEDVHFVSKSKYLKKQQVWTISEIEDSLPILENVEVSESPIYLLCSFDEAAEFVDQHEELLSKKFITPSRGKHIGEFFKKDSQCRLAEKCGLTVPRSFSFLRTDNVNIQSFCYPLLLKPIESIKGEKSDIHICFDYLDFQKALESESSCNDFILQDFIEKEYEIDCIGVRTDKETFISGGIRKIRHYPKLIGAGAYGLFQPMDNYQIDTDAIARFLEASHYYGPFSIEFLHKGNKDYFMEVNFRNEGLAYASTCAGANLHAMYVDSDWKIEKKKIRKIFMMNYSLDFLYVIDGSISLFTWIRDFMRTRCFINICFHDLGPTWAYYKHKLSRLF